MRRCVGMPMCPDIQPARSLPGKGDMMTGQINFVDEPIRILCVDDEQNVLRALRRMFLDEDYEIFTALSAEEGLEVLDREDEVQLVISDYRMPGQNGVDFLREVCRRRPDTVRIVLSGYADAGAIVDAINEGQIYKFIPKPWNDDDLKVTLDNALERYFLHKKNQQLMQQLQESNNMLQQMNENLEALVEDRAARMSIQNQALQVSQNILDALPVGVIGIDTNGTIVKANKLACEYLPLGGQHLIGLPREEFLSDELNALIDRIDSQPEVTSPVLVGDRTLQGYVSLMKNDQQEGLILTLVRQQEPA